MLTIRQYVRVESLEEAWNLNQKRSNRLLGGMMWLSLSHSSVDTVIDMNGLGLNAIEETEHGFSIGCMSTLRSLEVHENMNAAFDGVVRDALSPIVGVQFRNMATIGGSIFSRFGFSDPLTLFLALGADVELFKDGRVPLSQFIDMPRNRDVLVKLIVPKRIEKCVYLSERLTRTDFPLLTCAMARVDGVARIAVGARPGRARLLTDAERLLSDGVTEIRAREFSEYVAESLTFGGNMRGSAAYRKHLCRVLTKRACLRLGEG